MASPSELSLDCKPHHTHSLLLMKCFSDQTITPPPNPCAPHHHDHHQQQPQKLEEFLSRLEEERLKIDAFKRELPLCMQLLTNAMETSRQQLQAYRGTGTHQHQPSSVVLEEFIPMKNSSAALPPPPSEEIINKTDNKANWMTTAQLWSQETKPQVSKDDTQTHDNQANTTTMMGFNVRLESPKQRDSLGGGGGFLPFSKERAMPTLALAAAVGSTEMNDKDYHEDEKKKKKSSDNSYDNDVNDHGFSRRGGGSDGQVVVGAVESNNNGANGNLNNNNNNNNNNSSSNTSSQTHRKARRCWSPDLHRRFVNALQMLGGSQVATPKQIRELMKVDGLTNDEVKSHLQKYRLHTRRPSPSPQAPGGQPPQLVVLGGIWVPPEYAAAAAAAHGGQPTLYGATTHAPPPHFCAAPNSVPQDHYYGGMAPMHAAVPAPPHHHHHHRHHAAVHHHQVHVYKTASSQGHSSGPESDDRAAGRERSESIEDGKSDSSSWKAGESGENNGATAAGKGLAALRENGEECDRSEITLKF